MFLLCLLNGFFAASIGKLHPIEWMKFELSNIPLMSKMSYHDSEESVFSRVKSQRLVE